MVIFFKSNSLESTFYKLLCSDFLNDDEFTKKGLKIVKNLFLVMHYFLNLLIENVT